MDSIKQENNCSSQTEVHIKTEEQEDDGESSIDGSSFYVTCPNFDIKVEEDEPIIKIEYEESFDDSVQDPLAISSKKRGKKNPTNSSGYKRGPYIVKRKTQEELDERRRIQNEKERKRKKALRANLSQEELEKLRQVYRERNWVRRANLTQEQLEERRRTQRERQKVVRANLSQEKLEEQRKKQRDRERARREKKRIQRANFSQEELNEYRRTQREREKKYIAKLSQEELEERRRLIRVRRANRKLNLVQIEKNTQLKYCEPDEQPSSSVDKHII